MSSHSRSDSTSEKENVAPSQRYEQNPDTPEEVKGDDEPQSEDYSADELPPPNENSPTTTVMIYLAGDNNLTDECVYALTELKKAKNSGLVRIYVQFDPSDEYLPTQRYEVTYSGWEPIATDLIDQFPFKFESKKCLKIKPPYGEQRERKGESGTGDPRMLFNFVAFCVDQPHKPQPAPKTDHYVLIICGHGAGIQRDYLLRDDRPDGYLTIYELRAALDLMRKRLKGKHSNFKLDLFGMDVCLMSMAEVTYEFRDLVDIAIGSESYSPAAGWPYRQTIEQIDMFARVANASLPADAWAGIARNIVKTYVRFYSDYWLGGLSVSMSALRVSKVRELRHLVRTLANEMIGELYEERNRQHVELYGTKANHKSGDGGEDQDRARRSELEDQLAAPTPPDVDQLRTRKRYPPLLFSDALILAHWRAQSYNGELYVDLADFCDCLGQYMPKDSEIGQLCEELAHFIRTDFKIISCTFGRNYQYSYGVSIYFPWQILVPYYGASISFPEDSNWIKFLELYLKVTRRQPRYFYCTDDDERAEIEEKTGVREVDLNKDLFNLNSTGIRMVSDKMVSDKMGLDEGGNPIHSMRNPPIVFIPDCCNSAEVRIFNAIAQRDLMKDEIDPKDLLRDPRIKALEEKNRAWVLLTEEPPADPAQLEADNADES